MRPSTKRQIRGGARPRPRGQEADLDVVDANATLTRNRRIQKRDLKDDILWNTSISRINQRIRIGNSYDRP